MKDCSPNSKTKESKLLTIHFELAPLFFTSRFVALDSQPFAVFFCNGSGPGQPGSFFFGEGLGSFGILVPSTRHLEKSQDFGGTGPCFY